jgi:hypothetical protein
VSALSPLALFKCHTSKPASKSENTEDINVIPQKRFIIYGFYGLGAVLSFISFVMSIVFASKTPVFNQYCMVASFYTGIFGSLFLSNFIRIGLNALVAHKVAGNKDSPLRFFISNEAVSIIHDIKVVRHAEELINKQD